MTDLNFGVQWDSSESLKIASDKERERARLDSEKERDGRKMTPAQRRDHAYSELAEAASEQNVQRVKDLLAENPKIDFQVGALDGLRTSVVENFDPSIATMLVERGLALDQTAISNILFKRENEEMFVFLLETNSKNQKISHGVANLGKLCLKRFSPNVSDTRRNMYRTYHKRIVEKFPEFWSTISGNQYALKEMVIIFTPQLPDEEKQQIAALSGGKWKEVFTNILSLGRHSPMNANVLQSVVDFCNEYDFAKKQWDAVIEKMPKEAKVFNDFMDKYWPEGVEFSQSEVYKTINKFMRQHYHSSGAVKPPECHQKAKLGLTDREVAMLLADRWAYIHLSEKDGQKPPFTELPTYAPSNLIEAMVSSGSAACFALIEDPQGLEVYKTALSNPAVLYRWCQQAPVDLLNATLKNLSDLKEWSDAHNNTIAHYLVAFRQEKSKMFVQMLARHNHNWFLQENDNGVNVKTLFVDNKITQDTLAFLDKESIKRSLKEVGITKTKRSKDAPQTKRRM